MIQFLRFFYTNGGSWTASTLIPAVCEKAVIFVLFKATMVEDTTKNFQLLDHHELFISEILNHLQ